MEASIESLLRELEHFATENDRMWNVPPETGRFLHMLVRSTGTQNAIEVGTSNGYSGIWIASALRHTGGHLTTLEADPWKVELATENFRRAGVQDIVTIVKGDSTATLEDLEGPFDFAFIDAAKEQYFSYFKLLEPKIAINAPILADNAISHADHMRDYLDYVEKAENLETVLIPIGTGEIMSVKVR